jgi:hypothetical protein
MKSFIKTYKRHAVKTSLLFNLFVFNLLNLLKYSSKYLLKKKIVFILFLQFKTSFLIKINYNIYSIQIIKRTKTLNDKIKNNIILYLI